MERIQFSEAPAGLYQLMSQAQSFVDRSGIDPVILYLIKFRVSQINSCAYCLDMHFKDAVFEGETPQRLYSLSAWRETPYYTPKEQAVLAFAELLTKMPADEHSDHIHDELSKYFTKTEIGYITMAVVQINSWNRLVRSFGRIPGNYQPKGHATV